ncbi:MAG: sodium-independent anion transporter [Desulfuromonas sp.]|nr:MAG: sodium-independent anion transporter [Desulfuromonas sp.]
MSSSSLLVPKIVTVFREGYSRRQLSDDLLAGLIVGIVALPLAIAFAIASGVSPEQGLYTAIVAGFIISLLSGSRVQIGGPTGAFVVLVASIVQRYGIDGLALATLMAGGLLLVMGLARLGAVISYIPYPVTVGFTSGIALIIFAGQLRDLFGLQVAEVPAEFLEKIEVLAHHADSFNGWALLFGGGTILTCLLWPRLTRRFPGSLVAIVACTVLVQFFDLPLETIGSRFGEVPSSLPTPHLPTVSWAAVRELFPSALAIALLGGVESLLSAVVADGMTERRHRSNMELVAQGVANLVSPLFGGIPATGAIARTATNVKNGGRTPVAGMIHALTLLLILVFFGRFASYIPLATLAGILVVIALHMGEWHLFARLLRSPKGDVAVLMATFLLTVLVDLTVAIQVGVVLAAFLFMRRMVEVAEVGPLESGALLSEEDLDHPESLSHRTVPAGVEVYELAGPFFFGAADKFKRALETAAGRPAVLILRLRHVPVIDATGLQALENLCRKARRGQTRVILSGVVPQVRLVLEHAGFLAALGRENILSNIDAALARAEQLLNEREGDQSNSMR